ncbi:MAG: hypothetical protein H6667_17090 [Ardenticatenaceae bacterium]|nr:hypothetical protein [Ardenticatenaceae bacterium]MCB9443168.1 hypothetical protein [Ardenticatenaceae bacterium]
MITSYHILRQRLMTEWTNVHAAAEKAQAAYAEGGAYNVDAAALSLHGFYSGTERILEWIARQVDGTLPQGPAWHRELLDQMTLDVPGVRPPVLQKDTAKQLEEYLGFRHVVRNLYTWELDTTKVKRLIKHLPQTLQVVENDLETFGRFLDAASHADEQV